MQVNTPTISTIEQFCQRHPAFTPGGIRHIRFHEQDNGFANAFVQIGRRVYINEQVFFEIVLGQKGAPSTHSPKTDAAVAGKNHKGAV